ncbi:MAG TPA: ribosome silencing factor [Acidimicrobiia bacterium]
MRSSPTDANHRAIAAAVAADAKNAHDTVVLDVGDIIGITDLFVLTSATNTRQVRTVVDEIEHVLKRDAQIAPGSVEGLDDASWVLLDYGDVIVHVFLTDTRAFYDLDKLWADAPRVDWTRPRVTA